MSAERVERSPDEQTALLRVVEIEAKHLTDAVTAAEQAGVPPALLYPALISVFREAGMLPEGWEGMLENVMGMLGGGS